MRVRRLTGLMGILLLHACAVGPHYQAPTVEVADWHDASVERAAVNAQWWNQFNDPLLTAYVEAAQRDNLDIAVATARLHEARAQSRAARAVFWPTLGTTANYGFAKQSINSPSGASSLIGAGLVSRENEVWTSDIQASWEIDMFGGNRRLAQAAQAGIGQAEAQRSAVMLAITAEVVSSYVELRGAQLRFEIATRNIATQRETLAVTEQRVAIGLAPELDVLRARGQLANTQALLPALRTSVAAAGLRLGVLLGRAPESLLEELAATAPLPALPDVIPLGLRADIIRRRPDVQAAERGYARAVAELGVAQAQFFPRLTLAANSGFESGNTANLFAGDSRFVTIAPQLSLPLFTGGRLQANKQAVIARVSAAHATYQKAVLDALRDAETAYAQVRGEQDVLQRLMQASVADAQAARIVAKLYDSGLSGFLALLDAQRRATQSEDAQAQSETRLRLALILLYKSLGGNWPAQVDQG